MSALSGTIIDQHTETPVAGATVQFGSMPAVTTNASGVFDVPGTADTTLRALTISKAGFFTRKTKARSGSRTFGIVAATFDMIAFDDVSRQEYGSSTSRWVADPTVYIDTRPRGFTHADVPKWLTEIAQQAPGFIASWSNGAIAVSKIVMTASPPPDLSAGTIVIRLSEDSSDYGGSTTAYIGYALRSTLSDRSCVAGTVHMRYKGYAGNPNKRRGILCHELGHVFGMHHMSGTRKPSVMQPSIGSRTDLLAFDHLIAAFHYGREPACYSPDTYGGATKPRRRKKLRGAPDKVSGREMTRMVATVHEWVCGK